MQKFSRLSLLYILCQYGIYHRHFGGVVNAVSSNTLVIGLPYGIRLILRLSCPAKAVPSGAQVRVLQVSITFLEFIASAGSGRLTIFSKY